MPERPDVPRGRRRIVEVVRELHERLRTEGDSPARRAAAIALGTFIGCLPLYGAHLVLCVTFARLFRLNRPLTYLAAYINNPLTAPGLLAASFGIGHRLLRGTWPGLDLARIASLGPWGLGRDLFVGSVVLGLGLGGTFGAAAWIASRHAVRRQRWARVADATARRYLHSGILQWEFVRGKLRHDPLYRVIWALFLGRRGGRVLDLGCGRGIALALADAARREAAAPAAAEDALVGVDRSARAVRVARAALGDAARVEAADLARYDPPSAEVVLLLDVLHYLEAEDQERLLGRAIRALEPGGTLLVREPDAAAGARFRITRGAERLRAIGRGAFSQRFHYRSAGGWSRLLEGHGLVVTPRPLSHGTPFANVLFEVRKPARAAAGALSNASAAR